MLLLFVFVIDIFVTFLYVSKQQIIPNQESPIYDCRVSTVDPWTDNSVAERDRKIAVL